MLFYDLHCGKAFFGHAVFLWSFGMVAPQKLVRKTATRSALVVLFSSELKLLH